MCVYVNAFPTLSTDLNGFTLPLKCKSVYWALNLDPPLFSNRLLPHKGGASTKYK